MRNKNHLKKEKFVMLASSVLVLSALTLTGVYVKERSRIQNENYAKLSAEETEAATEESTGESSSPVNVGTAVNPQVDDALESDFGSYQARMEAEAAAKAEEERKKAEEKRKACQKEKARRNNRPCKAPCKKCRQACKKTDIPYKNKRFIYRR